MSIVAWGGVGKTALVRHWLNRLQSDGWLGAQRVYAWSFYSQGTREDRQVSEDTFLAHALEWFGRKCDPRTSPWDKGRLLADAIAKERTVLVLDGLEPLQYPPGPMGGRLRSPGVQTLLQRLTAIGNAGLCLLTTRMEIKDILDSERRSGINQGEALQFHLVT